MEAAWGELSSSIPSSDCSEFEFDDIHVIAEDLKVDMTCLMDLDPLIQNPVFDMNHDGSTATAKLPRHWNPCDAYSERIRNRFPAADRSLVSALGNSTYKRYLKRAGERAKNEKIRGKEIFPGPASDAQSSDFQDSALGSSMPSSVSIADTNMSYGAETGHSVRIPHLSEGAKEGNLISCVVCGSLQSIRTNGSWKRHIYKDLLPWECLDLGCESTGLQLTRLEWIAHLANAHNMAPNWDSIKCPLCFENTGDGKSNVTGHLSNHLEEISLGALPPHVNEDPIDKDIGSDLIEEDSNSVSITTYADRDPYTAGVKQDSSSMVCQACGRMFTATRDFK
jgi:hypothetical protein